MVLDQPLLDVSIIAQDPRRMQDLILPGRGYPCDRVGNVFHGRRRGDGGGNSAADRGSDGEIVVLADCEGQRRFPYNLWNLR